MTRSGRARAGVPLSDPRSDGSRSPITGFVRFPQRQIGLKPQQRDHLRHEIAASVISAGCDQSERVSGPHQLGGWSDAEQSSQVDEILRTCHVIPRKNLQRNEVSRPGHADP